MLLRVQCYLVIRLTFNNVCSRKLIRTLTEKLRLIEIEKAIIIRNTNKVILRYFENKKCFDRRYSAQNVTSSNGYTLLAKPITKMSRNKNLQQTWIWFYYYFTKVCRSLWCHRIWSLFVKYHTKNIASSYLNISFGWRYIPLALKKEYKTNQTIPAYMMPQYFSSSNINIEHIKWFRLDILSFAVKSFIAQTFKGPAVSTIELTTKNLKKPFSVCFLETSLQ